MAHHGHENSAKLEREVRAQRAEISDTLTEIRDRLSPGQLLDAALRSTGTRQYASRIGSVWCAILCQ
jgi:transcription elongation GreA/GreB family factor